MKYRDTDTTDVLNRMEYQRALRAAQDRRAARRDKQNFRWEALRPTQERRQ